jgi:hypothetical protein
MCTQPMQMNAISPMMDQFEAVSNRMPSESRRLLIENVDPNSVVAEDLVTPKATPNL